MRILMMTNSYTPYTGGVEKSIAAFTERFEQQGHSVLVVAPKADKPVEEDESKVFRVPAIKNFNDTNFPVTIPLPGQLASRLEDFEPEIVHSHFPFIIGSTAMRVAASYEIPLVFTYHTMYERYIHYINAESDHVRTFVKTLTTGYANLCDIVISPSEAVEHILRERGMATRMKVIPTGVDIMKFSHGDGTAFRQRYQIPPNGFVAGSVGRLASEKNLLFLTDAVGQFLKMHKKARFLVVGDGPQREELEHFVSENNLKRQVIFTGMLNGQSLIDAYHAMDVFVFSSKSETQGMVLAEAMAAGLPVIALKASGVTDILQDGKNGYMLESEDIDLFSQKIQACFKCSKKRWQSMKQEAVETANHFSIDACAGRVLNLYEQLTKNKSHLRQKDETVWQTAMDLIKAEWDIFCNYINAAGSMIYSTEPDQE